MKLKNVLLTLGLATTVAAGAMAFGMSNAASEPVIETKADSYKLVKDTIFLVGVNDDAFGSAASFWFKDCTPCVYYWGGTGDDALVATTAPITIINDTLGYVTLPYNTEHIKLVRTGTGITEPFEGYPTVAYNEGFDMDIQMSDGKIQNVIKITGCGESWPNVGRTYANFGATKTFIPQGTTVFFDSNNSDSFYEGGWSGAGAETLIEANGRETYYHLAAPSEWYQMETVGNGYYSFVATEHILCDYIRFIRYDNEYATLAERIEKGWNVWDAVWDHTTDVYSGWGFCPWYVTTLKNTGGNKARDWDQGSYYDTVDAYSRYFLNKVTCNGVDSVTGGDNWSTCKTLYDGLYKTPQGILWESTQSDAYSGTITKAALERYDLIVYKYGTAAYADFMGRKNSGGGYPYPASQPIAFIGSTDNTSLIIIAAGLVLTLIASLFLFRRKEQ